MFQETLEMAWQKTCLEAYAKGYRDAMTDIESISPPDFTPGLYGNKYYLPAYKEGFQKGVSDRLDVQREITQRLINPLFLKFPTSDQSLISPK